jgi:hypothetical protein
LERIEKDSEEEGEGFDVLRRWKSSDVRLVRWSKRKVERKSEDNVKGKGRATSLSDKNIEAKRRKMDDNIERLLRQIRGVGLNELNQTLSLFWLNERGRQVKAMD